MSSPARVFRASLTSGAEVITRQVVQLASAIVLARLLAPADFGAMAIVMLFVGIGVIVADGGLGIALVRSPLGNESEASTVFWVNLAFGLAVAALLVVLAVPISRYFALPDLAGLTLAMAANVVLSSLASVHVALLTRSLRFRPQLIASLVASVLSASVAIVLAFRGAGVWALAAQALVFSATTTVMLWLLHPWRPSLTFDVASARKLLGFGWFVLASGLADVVYSRAYSFLIGRGPGAGELGQYYRADSAQQIPTELSSSVITRVSLPLFAAVATERSRLADRARAVLRSAMAVHAPILLTCGALADSLTRTVFGDQWGPAVPFLRILCLSAALFPIHAVCVNVLLAVGHARAVWRLELLKKGLGILLIVGGFQLGLYGLAWAMVLSACLSAYLNIRFASPVLGVRAIQLFRDGLPALLIAGIVDAALAMLDTRWNTTPATRLMLLAPVGCGVYVALAAMLRLRGFHEFASAGRQALSRGLPSTWDG